MYNGELKQPYNIHWAQPWQVLQVMALNDNPDFSNSVKVLIESFQFEWLHCRCCWTVDALEVLIWFWSKSAFHLSEGVKIQSSKLLYLCYKTWKLYKYGYEIDKQDYK